MKEIFCKLKDDLEIYNQQDIFKIKCESCNKPNHNITNCPLLTFKKNREKAIQNYFDNMEFQNRKHFKRQQKKFKVRTGYKKFVLNHQKFLLQNDQLCYNIFKFNSYFCTGATFIENVENQQEELGSIFNIFQDYSISSLEFDCLNQNLEQNTQNNPFSKHGESNENSALKIGNSFKRLNHLSPLLKPIAEENIIPNEFAYEEEDVKNRPRKISLPKIHIFENINKNDQFEVKPHTIRSQSVMNEVGMDFLEFMMKFETLKNFKFYYPHNNADLVIKKLIMSNKKSSVRKKINRRRKFGKDIDNGSANISALQSETLLPNHPKEIKMIKSTLIPLNGQEQLILSSNPNLKDSSEI